MKINDEFNCKIVFTNMEGDPVATYEGKVKSFTYTNKSIKEKPNYSLRVMEYEQADNLIINLDIDLEIENK